jgi:hypothetical protein
MASRFLPGEQILHGRNCSILRAICWPLTQNKALSILAAAMHLWQPCKAPQQAKTGQKGLTGNTPGWGWSHPRYTPQMLGFE